MRCHHRNNNFVCGDDLRSVHELHHLNVLLLSVPCDMLLSNSRVLRGHPVL
jgi:hypothetical protein